MLFKTIVLFAAIYVGLSMASPAYPKNMPTHYKTTKRSFGDDAHFAPPERQSKRYSVSGDKWDCTLLTYGFVNTGNDLSADKVKSIFKSAFKIWSDQTVLRFTYADDVTKANIKIRFVSKSHPPCPYPFDGPGGTLAHAFYPKSGDIHIDNDETFTDGSHSGINLLSVAVHEIGHAIGIGHSKWTKSVMHDEYKGYNPNLKLHADDINAVSHLYGGPTAVTPATTVPPCVDKYSSCPQYANKCNNDFNVRNNCPYTCYVCRVKCGDEISKSLCESYKNLDLCSTAFVANNCRKTCQVPGSNCPID